MMRAKPAEQARSREKRDLIISALDGLLEQKPFRNISVAGIATAAGVPVATIYQRFHNEDAAASILLELYLQRVVQWAPKNAEKRSFPTSLHAALLRVAEDAWDQVNELQHIMRPAYLYSRQRPDLVGDTWRELQQTALLGFTSFLENYESELGSVDLKNAAGVLCYFFNFMVLGKLLHPDERHWALLQKRTVFAREMAHFTYAYLTIPRANHA